MEFYFNNLDNEGCQPTCLIPRAPQDPYVLIVEEVSIENIGQQTPTQKKYKTLSAEQKEGIIQGLKSAETLRKNLSLSDQRAWKDVLRGLENQNKDKENAVSRLDPKIWKKMLKDVIPRFVPEFDPSDAKMMADMWRKVKRMLESHGKAEKRGDPTLYDDELPEFKERLISIIRNRTSTSFKTLRPEVLPVINEIRARNGREMKNDVFSKHYWHEYLAKNPDIKELWEALPRSNANGKISNLEVTLSPVSQSTYLSSSETLMQSPPDDSVDEFGCVRFFSSESMFSREEYHSVFGGLEEIPHFQSSLDEEHSGGLQETLRFGNSRAHQVQFCSHEDDDRFKKSFIKSPFPDFEEETQIDSKENKNMTLLLGKYSNKNLSCDNKTVFGDFFQKQVFGGVANGPLPWKSLRDDDGKIELEDNVDHAGYASQKPAFAGLSNGLYL